MGVLAAILVRNPARLACIRERRRPLIVAGAALDLFPLAIALAVSLLLAHLSWTLFESPLVKYGHRFAYGKK